jgi:hypothetical protein
MPTNVARMSHQALFSAPDVIAIQVLGAKKCVSKKMSLPAGVTVFATKFFSPPAQKYMFLHWRSCGAGSCVMGP